MYLDKEDTIKHKEFKIFLYMSRTYIFSKYQIYNMFQKFPQFNGTYNVLIFVLFLVLKNMLNTNLRILSLMKSKLFLKLMAGNIGSVFLSSVTYHRKCNKITMGADRR